MNIGSYSLLVITDNEHIRYFQVHLYLEEWTVLFRHVTLYDVTECDVTEYLTTLIKDHLINTKWQGPILDFLPINYSYSFSWLKIFWKKSCLSSISITYIPDLILYDNLSWNVSHSWIIKNYSVINKTFLNIKYYWYHSVINKGKNWHSWNTKLYKHIISS